MDLSEFAEEIGSEGPVTIAGLGTRGGPVDDVRPVMAAAPGNLFAITLVGRTPIAPDAMTFTLWRDESSMRTAAYRPGPHRDRIDWYRSTNSADRTSFTRLRPRTTAGTWNGVDPMRDA